MLAMVQVALKDRVVLQGLNFMAATPIVEFLVVVVAIMEAVVAFMESVVAILEVAPHMLRRYPSRP